MIVKKVKIISICCFALINYFLKDKIKKKFLFVDNLQLNTKKNIYKISVSQNKGLTAIKKLLVQNVYR